MELDNLNKISLIYIFTYLINATYKINLNDKQYTYKNVASTLKWRKYI